MEADFCSFLVRIDCQNFDATVFDTQDLGTRRGGGLAMLNLPEKLFDYLKVSGLNAEKIYSGASEGLARVEGEEQRISQAISTFLTGNAKAGEGSFEAVVPFLCCSFSIVKEDAGQFLAQADYLFNENRRKQMLRPACDSLPRLDEAISLPCAYDKVRPVSDEITKSGDVFKVSKSVAARLAYGRKNKKAFYESETKEKLDFSFIDSIDELVESPPKDLPETVRNKVAVIYMDGNSFGDIRKNKETISNHKDQTAFSDHIDTQRRKMLKGLLGFLCKLSKDMLLGNTRLRMETLLWGGDELRIILPAWAAVDVLGFLSEELNGDNWKFKGHEMTHAVGMVVAHYKTPIRDLQNLATELANSAKGECRTCCLLQYQIFESIDLPVRLSAFREDVYGTDAAKNFTMHLDQNAFPNIVKKINRLKDPNTGLPRSQLYKLLNTALKVSENTEEWESKILIPKLKDYSLEPDHLKILSMSQSSLMGLIHLAQLWDYTSSLAEGAA